MIIRQPKDKQAQTVEIGDVLYKDGDCYLIIKSVCEEYPYGLVNLCNPSDYDEYKSLSTFEGMMKNGAYEHYKGYQVAVEVGVNE